MTGKQIAQILRKTRKKWGGGHLYNPDRDEYCVLGILAAERGIDKNVLAALDKKWDMHFYKFHGLGGLVFFNDTSPLKQQLIETLEQKFGKKQFKIGAFIQDIHHWKKQILKM
jgi:hypothetical protein